MEKKIITGIDGPIEIKEPKLKPGEKILTGIDGPIIVKNSTEEPERETNPQFLKIDRKSPEILSALERAPIYKKQGQVRARRARPGEEITTMLKSGAKETVNSAKDGDYIVENPSGEEYIISEAKFVNRYEATSENGVYAAKGYCRAIQNPFGRPIEIMAEWGSPQTGDAHCLIADVCDENGRRHGEPYIIEANAFAETYKPAEK